MAYTVKDILNMEVAPALGCTEPVAVALGAAAARSLAPEGEIESLEIRLDPNVYKNGLAVAIPGAPGMTGIDVASAIGACGGDATRGLEVLAGLSEESVRKAAELVRQGKVTANLEENRKGLYIHTILKAGGHVAESLIEHVHDNIVSLKLDGTALKESALIRGVKGDKKDLSALETWLKTLELEDLLNMVDDLDAEDLGFLKEGVETNMRLADYGLKHGPGLGVGRTLERLVRQRLLKRDMMLDARMLTSGASDARMAGVQLPAMSSAGSGNHGLTAVLPICAVRRYTECDEKTMLEAVGLSHLVTGYIKAHTGRLSAVCGCSVAAGAGAAAGVTYLLGGTLHHMAGAIKNLAEDLAGIICDGAKAGCALKLATAAGTAVQAALFALQGVDVQATDGIIGISPEQTLRNIGELSTEGMIETDRTILRIMLQKKFSEY